MDHSESSTKYSRWQMSGSENDESQVIGSKNDDFQLSGSENDESLVIGSENDEFQVSGSGNYETQMIGSENDEFHMSGSGNYDSQVSGSENIESQVSGLKYDDAQVSGSKNETQMFNTDVLGSQVSNTDDVKSQVYSTDYSQSQVYTVLSKEVNLFGDKKLPKCSQVKDTKNKLKKKESYTEQVAFFQKMVEDHKEKQEYANTLNRVQNQQDSMLKMKDGIEMMTQILANKFPKLKTKTSEEDQELQQAQTEYQRVFREKKMKEKIEKRVTNEVKRLVKREEELQVEIDKLENNMKEQTNHMIVKDQICDMEKKLAISEDMRKAHIKEVMRIKNGLKEMFMNLKMKKEELEDKKILVGKLNDRIENFQRRFYPDSVIGNSYCK